MAYFTGQFVVNTIKLMNSQHSQTGSGTEKRCSHNLQSGHPAWWSAGNRCFSHTNYFDKLEANRKEKMIKTLKNNIMHLCFSCISYLSFGTEIAGGN